MGIQLYLKSTISSKGTSAVFIYAQHKGKVFKKNIGVNVSPVSSKYTLPRMKQATNEVSEDLPLFM